MRIYGWGPPGRRRLYLRVDFDEMLRAASFDSFAGHQLPVIASGIKSCKQRSLQENIYFIMGWGFGPKMHVVSHCEPQRSSLALYSES